MAGSPRSRDRFGLSAARRVHADLGADDKARADLTKSYQAARLADAAIALGELAEKSRAIDEAIDYYLQAFMHLARH